jgi:hypothetical protein
MFSISRRTFTTTWATRSSPGWIEFGSSIRPPS